MNRAAATGTSPKSLDAGCAAWRSISTATGHGVVGVVGYGWSRSHRPSLEQVAAPSDPEPSEHLEALRQAIERLPAKQRQVVLMHYLEETSVNEVAALLSVTAKTVEGRLYQARRTLRRLLGNKSFGLADWKDAAMSVNLVPEDDLRAALRPYRVDPDTFEAAVRERLKAAERQRADEPWRAFRRS